MIVVTGATGQLGRLVVASLLKKVPAEEIVAAVRTPSKAADLAALGVQVREADYGNPASLKTAFADASAVLLVSSNNVGSRVDEHKAVIDAAKAAGVKLLAYTSVLRADVSTLPVAAEHLATEQYLVASGVPYVLLRNGWYTENYTAGLGAALEHGAILNDTGDGRIAAATREDYADAAAAVLAETCHANKTYELGGDHAFTLTEMAAEVSKQAGKTVVYKNVSAEEFAGALLGFGLPKEVAELVANANAMAPAGELDTDSHDLSTLIGRPTTTLAEAVAAAL